MSYDARGIPAKALIDTNRDGKPDTFQYYQDGEIARVEQDRNHDGRIDGRTTFRGGKRQRGELDGDGDGRFETLQRFDDPRWSMVVETDGDGDGRCEALAYYKQETLRRKETIDPATGLPARIEEFGPDGRIVRSREKAPGAAGGNIDWTIDGNESAVRAEQDSDGDGRPDLWYHYAEGHIERVEEDRNRDGRPDLWEEYDRSGAVVSRREDLDFDGVADIRKSQ
jgi:hypothetical protein